MADAKIINYGQPIGAGSTVVPDNNATALDVESVAGEEFIIADTATPKLILKAGGSASQDVEIDGNGNLSGSSGQYSLRATAATATGPNFCPDNGDLDTGIGSSGNDQLSLIAGGVEGIRIAKDDSLDVVYVGINGAADDVNNTLLQLNGDSDEAELAFKLSGGATTTMGYRGQAVFSVDANGGFQVRNHGGTKRLQVDANGNVETVAGVVTALTNNGGTASVSTSGSSTALVGVNTAFTTDFHVGAAIKVGSVITTVTAITDDNNLTLEDAINTGVTGTTCTRDSGELFAVKTGDSKTLFSIQPTGVIGAGANANSNSGVYNNIGIGDPRMFDKLTTGNALFVMGAVSGDYDFTTANALIGIGYGAVANSTTSQNLVAIGTYAADTSTNIRESVIIGGGAGRSSGNDSVHIGHAAGASCTGTQNVSIGREALDNSSAALESVAVGYQSLSALTGSVESNTGLGFQSGLALTSGQQCTFLGAEATTSAATLNNQTSIGYGATTDAANQVRVGNTSVSDIDGQVALTATSDARVKTNVEDLSLGLDFINALRPVSFSRVHPADWPEEIRDERYKKGRTVVDEDGNETIVSTANFDVETQQPIKEEFDSTTRSDGLIAQEVKAACETLGVEFNGIKENSSGKMGIQYSLLVAPLIKAVQELTARIEQLEGGD